MLSSVTCSLMLRRCAYNRSLDKSFHRYLRDLCMNHAGFGQVMHFSSNTENTTDDPAKPFVGVNTRLPLFDFQNKYDYTHSHPLRGKESLLNSRRRIVANVRPPSRVVAESLQLGDSGNWVRALQVAEEIIVRNLRLKPNHWLGILKTCIQDGRGADSERMFRSWLQKYPLDAYSNTNGYACVALAYAMSGDVANCRRIFQERIEMLSNTPVSAAEYLVLLEAHSKAGDCAGVDRLMSQIQNGIVSSKEEGLFMVSEAWRLLLESRLKSGVSSIESLNEMIASGHPVELSHLTVVVIDCIRRRNLHIASQLIIRHLDDIKRSSNHHETMTKFVCGVIHELLAFDFHSSAARVFNDYFNQISEVRRLSASPKAVQYLLVDKWGDSPLVSLPMHSAHQPDKLLATIADYIETNIETDHVVWSTCFKKCLQAGLPLFESLARPVVMSYLKGLATMTGRSNEIHACLSQLQDSGIDSSQELQAILFESYCKNRLMTEARKLMMTLISSYGKNAITPTSWSSLLQSLSSTSAVDESAFVVHQMYLSKTGIQCNDWNQLLKTCFNANDGNMLQRVIGSMCIEECPPNGVTYLLLAKYFNLNKQHKNTCRLLTDLGNQRLKIAPFDAAALVTEFCVGLKNCGLEMRATVLQNKLVTNGINFARLLDCEANDDKDFLSFVVRVVHEPIVGHDDEEDDVSALSVLQTPLNEEYFKKYPWGILERGAYRREIDDVQVAVRNRLKLRQPVFNPKSEFGLILMNQWPTPLHGILLRVNQNHSKLTYKPLPIHIPSNLILKEEVQDRTRSSKDKKKVEGYVKYVVPTATGDVDDEALMSHMPYSFPLWIRNKAKKKMMLPENTNAHII